MLPGAHSATGKLTKPLRGEGALADTFFEPLREAEVRAWRGEPLDGGGADADVNAAVLRGIDASIGTIPDFPDPRRSATARAPRRRSRAAR